MNNRENIVLKTSLEVFQIRKAAEVCEKLLKSLEKNIKPGISTKELDTICRDRLKNKGNLILQNDHRAFPASICTSINNVAVHGIPSDRRLEEGDLISIDISVARNDWYGDAAWTYIAGESTQDKRRLLKASWSATMAGINAAKAGNRLGDIGAAIEKTAKKYGCSVARQFAGHGIGKKLHEEPVIHPSGEDGTGLPVVPGMVLTIEPVLSLGSGEATLLRDGWTYITTDGSPAAQFEHTIAVFSDHTEILTLSAFEPAQFVDFPPYY